MSTTALGLYGAPFAGIGVYGEESGDVTAPVLSNPAATEITPFLCYASADTDEPSSGTAYAIVSTSATQPSVAQIQAGQDHTGSAAVSAISGAVSNSILLGELDGLAQNTNYYVHIQQQDAAGNDSAVVTSAQFTTGDSNPTASATTTTTANGSFDPDYNAGTAYYVVTTSATQPSIAQVQAGQDHLGAAATFDGSEVISVNAPVSIAITGLTASTTYYLHCQYEGPNAADSPVVSSASFATPATDPSASQQGATIGSGLRGPFGF